MKDKIFDVLSVAVLIWTAASILLKFAGVVHYSWWWVLSPALVLFIVVLISVGKALKDFD